MSKKSKKKEEAIEGEEDQKKFKITDLYKNKQYYAITNLVFWFGVIIVLVIIARGIPNVVDDGPLDGELQVKSEFEGYERYEKGVSLANMPKMRSKNENQDL